jgi:hypothetical protein
MDAATDAPAERTVEATEPALEETVLRQDDMIRSELGSSPFLPPFPRFIPSSSLPETTTTTNPDAAAAATSTRRRRRPSAIAASGAGEGQYHPQCPYSSRSPRSSQQRDPGSQLSTIPRRSDSTTGKPRNQQLLLPSSSPFSLLSSLLAVAFVCLSPSLSLK